MLSLLALTALATTPGRFDWWKEAKFGMFVHWGIYAVPADSTDLQGNKVAGEWYMTNKQVKPRDYEKFAPQFDPVKFDAEAWVRKAKQAGMKYIVITTKHHDGFCMWDTQLSDYSITKATPFKRDPMKELAAACQRQGMRLGFYHSIMDWHEPDYLPRRSWDDRPATGANLDRYIDHMKGQLKELLTGYGPVSVIWFDGGWEHTAAELHSQEVNDMIHSLQPNTLINDRNQLPADFTTPEQTIPADALPNGRAWETCMTMNDTWGYAANDTNWKSSTDLVHKICDIASKGGNFLLNVGPMATGEFPAAIDDRLAEVGKWMGPNGVAIYGTDKSPFRRAPFDGRVTRKGNTLYLEVFNWPADNRISLAGLTTPIRSAKFLHGGTLKVVPGGLDGVPKKIDPMATVIVVKLAGEPMVEASRIKPSTDGTLDLKASDAQFTGSVSTENRDGVSNIGFWTHASDEVSWEVDLPKAGTYRVTAEYSCPDESAGSTLDFMGMTWTVPSTGGWDKFKKDELFQVALSAGKQTLKLKVKDMPHNAVANIRSLTLSPS